jgi:N-acetylmuramoyl-L-alanine amidase
MNTEIASMPSLNLKSCALTVILLSGCVSAPVENPMAQWSPSANFDERRPRLIVLHGTEMQSSDAALAVLKSRNAGGRVSAHYLIADDGRILQLVADSQRAWHAGAGRWRGLNDINSVSIGIELDNDGIEPFSQSQVDALLRLLDDLCARYDIPRSAIIGHSDMAPARKKDPGVRFPWRQLAEAGYGVWYSDALSEPPPEFDAALALAAFGYDTRGLPAAVRAFHLRFRAMDTEVLDELDRKILYDLVRGSETPGGG